MNREEWLRERLQPPDTDRCRWRCDFLDAHLMARKGIPIRTVLRDQGFVINKERH